MIGSRHHTIPFQQSRPRMSYVGSKDSRPVSVAPGVVGSHIDRGRDIGNGGRAPEASHRDGQRGNKRGWDSYSDRERDFDRNASRDLRRPVGHAGFERGRDDMRGLDKQRFEERSQRRIDEKKTVYSERHADLRMGRYRSGSDSAATSWSSASNGREAVPIVNISRSMDRNSRSTTAQGGRSHGRKGEERELGELPSVTKTGEKQVSNSQEIQSDKESGELSRSTKEGVLQAQDSEEMEPGELPSESTTESITWSANTSIPGGSNHESELDDRGRRSSPHKKPKFTPVVWDYVAQQVQPNKFSDGLVSGPVIGLMSNAIQDSSVSAHNLPLSIPTLLSSPSQISSITPLPSIHEFPAAVDRGISSTSSGSPSSVTSFSIAELGMSPKTVGLNHKSELGGTDRKDNMSRSAGEDADFEAGQCSPEVGERGEETLSPAPITIANSRWAEIDETPEQIESPIQAGGLRSSLGSDNNITALTENGKGGNRNLRNHSESNKILREKFTITHAKGKGNKSDDLGKDLPSKLLADQEYEQELNKRELMELYEEESDGEDEEEPRPYEDSEPEDFVDGSSEHARKFDMLQGCRSVNEFQLLNKIDEGTYGVVYRARNKQTGEIVALKRVKMEGEREGFPLTALREINVLLSLHHPSVVDVKEIVVGSTIDRIYTVMEYMEHELKGLMESLKQPFSTSEVKCLMLQLFEGVQYLHDNWVLHRDLKTSNLLMNNAGELKICDFGLARQYGSPLQIYSHMVVTLWYRAPELLLGSKQYSTAIDMWSLGCIMAELLAKQPLLTGKSEIDQIDKIFKMLGTPNEKIWPEYSKLPGVQCNFVKQPYNRLKEKFPVAAFGGGPSLSESGFDLLNRLLTYDPRKRITADEALKHAWFREDPLPKAKELMPTYPARSEHARRRRRLVKSPDPLQKEHKKEMGRGEPEGRGLFG